MEQNETTTIEMSAMEIHKVAPPPHKTTLQKLKTRLKETFFPDDPLRQFKGQPLKKKLILGAQYVFPILEWGPNYSFKLLKSDIVSALTIASLAIPQGISYAKLANLPPIVGLHSSFVPPLVYAVLGSSRDLAVGPVSIASLVLGSMLREVVSPTKDPILFLQLAFSSTFFAGLLQASLGFFRLLMHQLRYPMLKHNFREGNMVAHLLEKEGVKNFKRAKCVHHARPPLFVEHQLLKDKHVSSTKFKYVTSSVCEKLAKYGNENVLRDYVRPI